MKAKLLKILDTFLPAIILGSIVLILFKVILLNGYIPSQSMEPTLSVENLVIANRLAYNSNKTPQRGDIVIFKSDEYDFLLVKRVIGIGGDKIKIEDGQVYLNDNLLNEPYVVGETFPLTDQDEFVVPEGCIFLMGDNRENSADSRAWKNPYIKIEYIQGKVVLEYSLGGDDGFFIHKK